MRREIGHNPRPVGVEDFVRLYEAAFEPRGQA